MGQGRVYAWAHDTTNAKDSVLEFLRKASLFGAGRVLIISLLLLIANLVKWRLNKISRAVKVFFIKNSN